MDEPIVQAIKNGLSGRMSHVSPEETFEGLDWRLAGGRPSGCNHTIWQLLNHLIYWQDFCQKLLAGQSPISPEHAADSWIEDDAPANELVFHDRVSEFLRGIESVDSEVTTGEAFERQLPANAKHSQIEVLMSLIAHNSYHLGQIVQLRQQLGSWPPPSGGNTW